MRAYTSLPTCAKKGSMVAVMAIYHFSAKIISRANRSSAAAGFTSIVQRTGFFALSAASRQPCIGLDVGCDPRPG